MWKAFLGRPSAETSRSNPTSLCAPSCSTCSPLCSLLHRSNEQRTRHWIGWRPTKWHLPKPVTSLASYFTCRWLSRRRPTWPCVSQLPHAAIKLTDNAGSDHLACGCGSISCRGNHAGKEQIRRWPTLDRSFFSWPNILFQFRSSGTTSHSSRQVRPRWPDCNVPDVHLIELRLCVLNWEFQPCQKAHSLCRSCSFLSHS